MKKISIVVPVYNGEKYIENCIKSLLKQNLLEIEIILINDGSKDKTEEICLRLKEESNNKIKYYKIENKGCSIARNFGIKVATGEYIGFVDADDWIDENMYFDMYQNAKEKNLDILICGYKKIGVKKNKLEEVYPEEKDKAEDYIDMKTEWFNSPWNKIYKLELVKEINFLENCHMGEDMVFNCKAFSNSKKVGVLKKSYYNYFFNETSVTQNPTKKIEIYLAIKEIKKIGVTKIKLDECIRYHGIISPFYTLEYLKENYNNEWKKYYLNFEKNISDFKQDISLTTIMVHKYRKLRLKFVFLKKYLRCVKKIEKNINKSI